MARLPVSRVHMLAADGRMAGAWFSVEGMTGALAFSEWRALSDSG